MRSGLSSSEIQSLLMPKAREVDALFKDSKQLWFRCSDKRGRGRAESVVDAGPMRGTGMVDKWNVGRRGQLEIADIGLPGGNGMFVFVSWWARSRGWLYHANPEPADPYFDVSAALSVAMARHAQCGDANGWLGVIKVTPEEFIEVLDGLFRDRSRQWFEVFYAMGVSGSISVVMGESYNVRCMAADVFEGAVISLGSELFDLYLELCADLGCSFSEGVHLLAGAVGVGS